jgi:aryl-alcohol dehydrogenase-like predicted oxidoreductase
MQRVLVGDYASKLALGTAQLGLDYGVSNTRGRVAEDEAGRIFERAFGAGIRTLDTAHGYGESEAVIGRFTACGGRPFGVVTKVPDSGDVVVAVGESLKRLGSDSVDAVLVHLRAGNDFTGDEAGQVWRGLETLKREGRARKIGVSVHSPETLPALLKRLPIELVQIPFNVLDRRFLSDELLALYRERGVEVHARSIFLQGTFFLDPEALPPKLAFAAPTLRRLRELAREVGISAAALSFAHCLREAAVAKCVFAVTSANELEEILSWNVIGAADDFDRELAKLRTAADPRLLDPLVWMRS